MLVPGGLLLTNEKHDRTGCVVLAQASMTAAERYLAGTGMLVYSSPALAAERALAIADRRSQSKCS